MRSHPAVAGRDPQRAVGPEANAAAVVEVRFRQPLHEHGRGVGAVLRGVHVVPNDPVVAARRVARVDEVVRRVVRVYGDAHHAGLTHRGDVGRRHDGVDRPVGESQLHRAGPLREEHSSVREERHVPRVVEPGDEVGPRDRRRVRRRALVGRWGRELRRRGGRLGRRTRRGDRSETDHRQRGCHLVANATAVPFRPGVAQTVAVPSR